MFVFVGYTLEDRSVTSLLTKLVLHVIPVLNVDQFSAHDGCVGSETSQLYNKFTEKVR